MIETSAPPSVPLDSLVAQIADEFTQRQKRGEQPDIEAYAAPFPEHAAVIRNVLASLQLIRMPATGPDGMSSEPLSGYLGDFRILREVGRGGMGIVYEAEQISLGRRVALKILPFAATMDPRHLQRFQNEARAAASLEHPHIVPVYGVGCERGVHYYAMKFIDGHSLAEVIADFREKEKRVSLKAAKDAKEDLNNPASFVPSHLCVSPDLPQASPDQVTKPIAGLSTLRSTQSSNYFRQVAELGIQTAEALEHAHSLGIVHRDIKPANLMIESSPLAPQGRGVGGEGLHLWITDFGLARTAADAGLTMTGDVLGTLRYMSPEQALAKHGLVDHRTDVYSLGVTLYELLTGTPAMKGKDREEILNAITLDEPQPPRALDSAIPPDLETIVLKALEKNPADRYATAPELADDLRRFLEHRPIQARRPSWGRVAAKWVRRHRGLVGSLAGVTTLSAVILVAGLIWHNAKLRDAAEHEHDLVETANHQKAEADRKRAFARRAADKMYTRVVEKWLIDEPGSEALQREFLEEALRFYQELAAETDEDPGVQRELANAHRRMGEIFLKLGQPHKAEAALNKALAIAEALTAENPEQAEYEGDLAYVYFQLGRLRSQTSRLSDSENAFRRCLNIHRKQAAQSSSAPGPEIAKALSQLGMVLVKTSQLSEAEEIFREARRVYERLTADSPDMPEHHISLGGALNNLAVLLVRMRKLDAARPLLEEAIAHQRTALQINPRNKEAIEFLKNHYSCLSGVLDFLGPKEEALNAARESLAAAELLVAQFPEIASYRSSLAQSQFGVGISQLKVDHFREAEDAFRSALATMEKAARDMPKAPFDSGFRAAIHFELGVVLAATGRPRDAVTEYQMVLEIKRDKSEALNNLALLLAQDLDAPSRDSARAVELANRAVEVQPNNWEIRRTLGVVQYRASNWKAAITALEKAQQLHGQGDEIVALFLGMAYWQRGDRELARGCYDQARELAKGNDPKGTDLGSRRKEAAELLGITAEEKGK
jgi:serine/threonine protein kinase/Flp pilus assembly protein TadD